MTFSIQQWLTQHPYLTAFSPWVIFLCGALFIWRDNWKHRKQIDYQTSKKRLDESMATIYDAAVILEEVYVPESSRVELIRAVTRALDVLTQALGKESGLRLGSGE